MVLIIYKDIIYSHLQGALKNTGVTTVNRIQP